MKKMSYINFKFINGSLKHRFCNSVPKTCYGFPRSDTNNIKANYLKLCGIQGGIAPLHTQKMSDIYTQYCIFRSWGIPCK